MGNCQTCGRVIEKNRFFCGLSCFKKRTIESVPVTLEIELYIEEIEQEKVEEDKKEAYKRQQARNFYQKHGYYP